MRHKLDALRGILDDIGSAVVCFSGGVDSTFLLKVAVEQLCDRALALTAQSPSLPRRELEQATALAEQMGARHLVLETRELDDERYSNNPSNRCYFCKSALLDIAASVARDRGINAILIGTNIDDLNGHRPGMQATREQGARHPLVEARLGKAEIRELSRQLSLPTWDKPELACLASRIPYGTSIDAERLQRIERMEALLADLGFRGMRVRFHDTVARIELPADQIQRAAAPEVREQIVVAGRDLGFTYVTLDLQGYRRGAMNEVLTSDRK